MNESIPPPQADETGGRDVLEIVIAGALSLVPGFGPWLSTGFQKTFAQQGQLRLNAYLSQLAQVVNMLTETVEGLTAEGLAASSEFYEAAVKAARAATTTTSREKHRALQNALFNVGIDPSADSDLRLVFIRYVDELTDTHVRILREFAGVGDQYIQIDTLRSVASDGAEGALYVADLEGRGLIEERPLFTRNGGHMTTFASSLQGGYRISGVGRRFLSFVAGPFDREPDEAQLR